MINPKELGICKRRGHQIRLGALRLGEWSQCSACGTWVREVTTMEERENSPPENEISPGFGVQTKVGLVKLRRNNEPIDKDELDICKRRGHSKTFAYMGWEQCKECKMWVRENRKIEEREERPAEDV